MTPEEFRNAGYRIVDWIADYRKRLADLPVWSRSRPGEIRAKLPQHAPRQKESFEAVLHDLEHTILPGLCHWQHPNFFGYFPSNATLTSVLGDFLSTGTGQIGLNWQSSPALTELEEVMTDWMRQLVGLSDGWSGVIQDTASTSTLVALLCAREQAGNYCLARNGLQEGKYPLVVYASTQSHSSVEKAALLAGFGRNHLRLLETDESHAMRTDLLEKAIQADLSAGRQPCAVVATTGTTATTALDPIAEIAGICRRHKIWLHVDSALAGSAMILPECRWMWQGIEEADSLVLNPHKWLGAAFDCSLFYVRQPQHLVRVMSTNPSYLQTAADGQVKNYRDWGIPLGRRFRALKLWFLLRLEGVEALQTRLRRDMENAKWLADQVDAAPDWVRLAPVPLQTVCVRHEPAGMKGEALDTHTLAWVGRINASGSAFVSSALLNQQWMVRISIGSEPTERTHVERLWARMQEEVRKNE